MKSKTPKAKYKNGDTVYCTMIPNQTSKILGEPQWNGLTYMYAFEGTDLRCGEQYLQDIKYIKS